MCKKLLDSCANVWLLSDRHVIVCVASKNTLVKEVTTNKEKLVRAGGDMEDIDGVQCVPSYPQPQRDH